MKTIIYRILILATLLTLLSGACIAGPTQPSHGDAETAAAQTWQAMQVENGVSPDMSEVTPTIINKARPTNTKTQQPITAADLTATPSSIPASLAAASLAAPPASQTPALAASLTPIPTLTTIPTKALKVAPQVGALAPDFSLVDARTGKMVQLSALSGQPVMIFFWATWCGFCTRTMPPIENTYNQYKSKGFVVLAVDHKEGRDLVAAFGNQQGLSYNLLLDSKGSVTGQYQVGGFPTSFFVRRSGVIDRLQSGAMSENNLQLYVSAIAD